jgi:hypothetical protein
MCGDNRRTNQAPAALAPLSSAAPPAIVSGRITSVNSSVITGRRP